MAYEAYLAITQATLQRGLVALLEINCILTWQHREFQRGGAATIFTSETRQASGHVTFFITSSGSIRFAAPCIHTYAIEQDTTRVMRRRF